MGKEWGQMVLPSGAGRTVCSGRHCRLSSSVLMIAIPPKVAGVKEIILCTPPRDNGRIPLLLWWPPILPEWTAFSRIGGAQAIAAMAYGTQSVPRVDKICGPGNKFIVLAKKRFSGWWISMPCRVPARS